VMKTVSTIVDGFSGDEGCTNCVAAVRASD
jgi:hypothetical protein